MGLDGFLGFDVAVGATEGSGLAEVSGAGGVISGAEAVGLGGSETVAVTLGLGRGSVAEGAGVGADGGGAGGGNVR
jgi:hypothetical protein